MSPDARSDDARELDYSLDPPEPELEPEPEPQRDVQRERAAPARPRVDPEAAPTAPAIVQGPLVRSSRPEWALATAGVALAIYIAASFGGQRGLFPVHFVNTTSPDWAERIMMALRGLVLVLLGGGCLMAGAALFATIEGRRLGDLRVLAARCHAIAGVALLIRMVPLDVRLLKQIIDSVGPLLIAWALVLLFFRISPRAAGVFLGGALVALVMVAFGSAVVSFALR